MHEDTHAQTLDENENQGRHKKSHTHGKHGQPPDQVITLFARFPSKTLEPIHEFQDIKLDQLLERPSNGPRFIGAVDTERGHVVRGDVPRALANLSKLVRLLPRCQRRAHMASFGATAMEGRRNRSSLVIHCTKHIVVFFSPAHVLYGRDSVFLPRMDVVIVGWDALVTVVTCDVGHAARKGTQMTRVSVAGDELEAGVLLSRVVPRRSISNDKLTLKTDLLDQ